MPSARATDGEQYERAAEALLNRAGLVTVERNWSCRMGEIDLVMREGSTLVFVEVRKRDSQRFGGAAASIGRSKQERLERAISLYLAALAATPACRVDAVLFERGKPQWIKDVLVSRDG